MLPFPPQSWDVRFIEDMDSYSAVEVPSKGVALTTLLAVSPADGNEGEFRLIISGSDPVSVRIPVADIMPLPPASALSK